MSEDLVQRPPRKGTKSCTECKLTDSALEALVLILEQADDAKFAAPGRPRMQKYAEGAKSGDQTALHRLSSPAHTIRAG